MAVSLQLRAAEKKHVTFRSMVVEIEKQIPDAVKEYIRNQDKEKDSEQILYEVREKYGFPLGRKLSEYTEDKNPNFQAVRRYFKKFGVVRSDDMYLLIKTCLFSRLQGKEFSVEKILIFISECYDRKVPREWACPSCGEELRLQVFKFPLTAKCKYDHSYKYNNKLKCWVEDFSSVVSATPKNSDRHEKDGAEPESDLKTPE